MDGKERDVDLDPDRPTQADHPSDEVAIVTISVDPIAENRSYDGDCHVHSASYRIRTVQCLTMVSSYLRKRDGCNSNREIVLEPLLFL